MRDNSATEAERRMQMPDGSLLVADEENGAIYRVSYKR